MTSEYYEQLGRDVERKKDIDRKIRQAMDAEDDGFETKSDFAIGYDAWVSKKSELAKDGWEVRPYTEECSFFLAMHSALFQRKKGVWCETNPS